MRGRVGVTVVVLAACWFAATALVVVLYQPALRLSSARVAPSAGPADEIEDSGEATTEPPDGGEAPASPTPSADEADPPVEVLLTAAETYVVERGDTVASIAAGLGVDEAALVALNRLTSDTPPVGLVLRVPATEPVDTLATRIASSPELAQLDVAFDRWAALYEAPPELTKAISWWASEWDAGKVGTNGQVGVGQLLPSLVVFTENDLLSVTLDGGDALDPSDPDDGVQLMTRYVAWLLTSTEGDTSATLAAYSQGLRSQRGLAWDQETLDFIGGVLELRVEFLQPGG